jgi:lipid II:glycine glycyltransferase (peptidoglycan interpeptide bridge formation enzyme)
MMQSSSLWNEWIARLPESHLLQTWEWGQVKAHYGWKPLGITWYETRPMEWHTSTFEFHPGSQAVVATESSPGNGYTKSTFEQSLPREPQAAALILQRTLSIGRFAARLRVMYIPKGPILDWTNAPLRRKVIDDLQALARQRGAIFIKIDPDVRLGEGVPGQPGSQEDKVGAEVTADLHERGWHFSDEQIQFRNTVLIDLSPSEEEILGRMKQKTRYNIRLAERKGVTVRVGKPADWGLLYHMYAETSLRDGFVIRDEGYYHTIWDTFYTSEGALNADQPGIEPLIAEVAGEPVAAVLIYRFAGKAWYLSGMSVDAHREKMPNYLLQWEAMRRAKAAGCTVYDLWGAPEVFNEMDSLWGVFRFKEGLGGKVVRTLGAWDFPSRPVIYRLYTQILPRLLDLMRQRGKERTRQITLGG